jgi:hypothetical protein
MINLIPHFLMGLLGLFCTRIHPLIAVLLAYFIGAFVGMSAVGIFLNQGG